MIIYCQKYHNKVLEKFLKCMIENKISVYKEYTCQSALSLLEFYFMKNNINENLKKDIEKGMNLSLKEIIIELKNYFQLNVCVSKRIQIYF